MRDGWCKTGIRGPTHSLCVVSPPGNQVFVRVEVSSKGDFAMKKTAEVKFARIVYKLILLGQFHASIVNIPKLQGHLQLTARFTASCGRLAMV